MTPLEEGGEEGPSPPPDASRASPAPPEPYVPDDEEDEEEEEPRGALRLELFNVRRLLRTVEAERDGWKAEALALRAGLGVPTYDPWKRRKPGLGRRVYPDGDPSEWI